MKLGLLVVVAVAVLLPSFSESRIVSRCELRDQLGPLIRLPRQLQGARDLILARVICEANRRSNLNSNLIRVFGKHRTTTAVPQETTAAVTGVNPATTEAATFQSTAANPATTGPTTTTTTTTPTTTTTIATNTTTIATNATTIASPAASESPIIISLITGGNRRKRDADSEEMSTEDMLDEEENQFDEEEVVQDDDHISDEDSEEDKGRRKSKRPLWPWSLSLYGLFQLSDSHFCASGYRWSRNVCRTSCAAFADDDIRDDIACFVRSGYWRAFLRKASFSPTCRDVRNFFSECH